MPRPFAAALAILLALATAPTRAQYASVEQNRADREAAERDAAEAARRAHIGRQYWVVPNPDAIFRLEFREANAHGGVGDEKFVLTDTVSFTVTGFDAWGSLPFVQVTFKDGKVAYLTENLLFRGNPKTNRLFLNLYELGEPMLSSSEYILAMPPDELRAAARKQRAKAAAANAAAVAARKARGGVSLGMTAGQVRASSWGKPSSINRSTGSYGVHEQWVYGGGNYIYFENGRVTSIQN